VDRFQIREGEVTYRREGQIWNVQGVDVDLWNENGQVRGELQIAEGVLPLPQRSLAWGNLQASVAMSEQDLTVTRLGIDVGDATVEVTGRVQSPFERVKLDLALTAQLPLARHVSVPGTIRLEGRLMGTAQRPHFQGGVRLEGEKWPTLDLRLTADRDGLRGERLKLRDAAGEVSGGFSLQWKDRSYDVWVRGRGLQLDQLATPLLGTMPVTGRLALQATAEGRGGTVAGLSGEATFQVTSLMRRGQPVVLKGVEGLVKADRGRISLERLQVDLPPNRLTVHGTLWKELNLEMSGTFPRVDLVGRLLRTKKPLGGGGTVVGRVTGLLSAPAFRGTLTWDAPRLLGKDFRQIRGEILVEQRTLTAPRLIVTKGKSTGTIRLRLALAEERNGLDLKRDLWIEAKGEVKGVPRDFLSLFVRREIPFTGRLTLDASVTGGPGRLEGQGHFVVKDAVLLGEPWQAVGGDLRLEPDRLLFEGVRLTRGPEQATGSGVIHFKAGETNFRVDAAGLSLKGFRLFAGTGLRGKIRVKMRGEGRLDNPTIRTEYALAGLRYTTAPLGRGRGILLLQDREMTGQLDLPERGYVAKGTLNATSPYPYRVQVTMKQADLAPLFALTGIALLRESRGTGSGTAEVLGNLKARRPSQLTIELEAPSLRIHGQAFHTAQPFRLEIREDTLDISSFAVTGETGWLNARGTIGLQGAVDLDVKGKIPLAVVLPTPGAITGVQGAGTLDVTISGLWKAPRYTGWLEVTGGSLRLDKHPELLEGIAGRVDFQGQTIRVPNLQGRWAGGEVKLGGTASRREGKGWGWLVDLRLDGADAKRVSAWKEKGAGRMTGRMNLRAKLTADGRRWEELRQSLSGKARVAFKGGKFRQFTVVANIVRILNLTPDPTGGVPYDTLKAHFRLKGGVAETQDLKFVSNTMNVGGVGKIDLGRGRVDILLGVQPLRTVDRAVTLLRLNDIPLLGRLLLGEEGSVLVVAVEVKGSLAEPQVAVVPGESLGRGIFGIFHRLLELPADLAPTEKSGRLR
jgi:autotransporter translocation and assembly factor TamB